jgi:hypothetical protein
MEFGETMLLLGGFTLGLGSGLMVHAYYRLREVRRSRWFKKNNKRYQQLIAKLDRDEMAMRASVAKLATLGEYNVSK